MPNKKSAEKELRKSTKREKVNKALKEKLKDLVKDNLKSVAAKDLKVKEDVRKTIKAIDKLAKKGIIKKNTASRKKSKLQKKVNTLK